MAADEELRWHKDGHLVEFVLDKSNLTIVGTTCPLTTGECINKHGSCVVQAFINLYGMECNVGIAPVSKTMEFAWALVGDRDGDVDSFQVWIIPVEDEIFSAWETSQIQNASD